MPMPFDDGFNVDTSAETPMLDEVLAGDTRIIPEWVALQAPAARPALRAAALAIHTVAYDLLLRDVPAFMRFKTPDPPPVLPRDLFRSVIDTAMKGGDANALRALLADSSLNELYALMRVCDAVKSSHG